MASQINSHIQTGQKGEILAATYLQSQGYSILHKNYRIKRAEIDLIVEKNGLLIFVEVKTRATDKFGFPEEAVSSRKEIMLLNAAEAYVEQQNWQKDIRFDIVSITLATPDPFIHHIKDAFH